jgi:PAT family beta-lactamase induction signal transducer AmpG
VGSTGGVLSEAIGWVPFFVLTTVASLPALLLLVWIDRSAATQSDRARAAGSLAGERNL